MTITINGTTGIAGVNGSASTPALQGTDTNTGVYFGTDLVYIATGGTAAVTVDSGQRTTFPTTIAVGAATPSTSGSGVSFPATQSASTDANTLDDYEEGTWTPTMYGSTSAGTTTYSVQVGRYTRIGNVVTASTYLGWTNATGTGNMLIGGLPFSSLNVTNLIHGTAIGYVYNLTTAANTVPAFYLAPNATNLTCNGIVVAGGNPTAIAIDTAAEVIFTITYLAA